MTVGGCLFTSQQVREHYSSRIKLYPIPSFTQSGPPVPGMVSSMFRVDLSSIKLLSGNTIRDIPKGMWPR